MNVHEFLSVLEEFWWLFPVSIAIGVILLLMIPMVIVLLPENYFACRKPPGLTDNLFLPLRITLLIIKNITGLLFLILGFILLFIPGQGLLTILTALFLMNFPGKRSLEFKIVGNRKVLAAMNWIRVKSGKNGFKDICS